MVKFWRFHENAKSMKLFQLSGVKLDDDSIHLRNTKTYIIEWMKEYQDYCDLEFVQEQMIEKNMNVALPESYMRRTPFMEIALFLEHAKTRREIQKVVRLLNKIGLYPF